MTQIERQKENVEALAIATPMQQGILAHSLQAAERDPYYQPRVFELNGELDRAALQRAWEAAVSLHPVLRTDYRWAETDKPVQVVYKRGAVAIQTLDWSELPEAAQTAALEAQLAQGRRIGFDFQRAADPKLCLVRLGTARHWLIWTSHHIVLDGWSVALVLGDVLKAYSAAVSGVDLALRAPSRYLEYVALIHRQDRAEALEHWRQLLSGVDALTALPGSPGARAPGYFEQTFELSAAETQRVQASAKATGVTVNTLMQGAWGLLLARYADASEVVFGSTVSGRSAQFEGAEQLTGLFINTLPVRVSLRPAEHVRDWLRALQQQNAASRRYEHMPLGDIRRSSELQGEAALFESVVVFDNYPIANSLRHQPAGLAVAALDREGAERSGRNNFPLSFIVAPGPSLSLTLAYACERFEAARIAELGAQLKHVILQLVASAEQPLAQIGLAAAAAPEIEWGEELPASMAPSVLSMFAQQVALRPAAPALQSETRVLSYAALDAAANAVARHLSEQGVTCESRVGVCALRSCEFVVALLGVLKAGAVYVPLDPKLPAARISEVAHSAGAMRVLSQAEWLPLLRGSELPVDVIEQLPSAAAFRAPVHPAQAAYMIFTSGSTGRPKGVVVGHGALARYVVSLRLRLQLEAADSMAMVSTVAADLGHTTLFGALCTGATLHVISEERAFDADAFAQYMSEHAVKVLKIAPTHLKALLHAQQPAQVLPAKLLILGGEVSERAFIETLRGLSPECRLVNHYGPTETSVGVATHELLQLEQDTATLPLGRPLPGVELYVLDRWLQRVPDGVPAELYIAGERLARGYHGSAALTAEHFVPNPFGPSSGSRMYRSGDRVLRHPNGVIEFLGRLDRQVKVRGYRVELGEIEAGLRAHAAVREAHVLARVEGTSTRLYGYVTAAPSGAPHALASELREHLQRVLPEYMLPAQVFVLECFPVTANGKLDAKALPSASLEVVASEGDAAEPQSESERVLLEIWQAVLKRERVRVTDNYFELGGDSILGLQIVARARKRGLRLTPKQIFGKQTIRALAASVNVEVAADGSTTQPTRSSAAASRNTDFPLTQLTQAQLDALPVVKQDIADIYPLSPMQQGMLFHTLFSPESGVYVNQVCVTIEGLDAARFVAAVDAVQARHEILRTSFVPEAALQIVHRSVPSCCEERDYRGRGFDTATSTLLAQAERAKGFDLSRPPLQRVLLVRIAERRYQLIWTHHHVLIDGWSSTRQIEEVFAHYLGETLPAPTASFRDYIVWLAAREPAASEQFWKRQLASLDQPTLLAGPREVSAARSEFSRWDSELSTDDTAALRSFARAERVTFNTLVQAAFLLVLQRLTGQASVALGITVAGRPPELPGMETLLGPFLHSLPLIATPRATQPVGVWLRELQQHSLDMREHEHTPLHEIQRWAHGAGQALFDCLLSFQNLPVDHALQQRRNAELKFEAVHDEVPTHYALSVRVAAEPRLRFSFGYWRSHFEEQRVRALAEQVVHVLRELSSDARRTLGSICVTPPAERALLATWNDGSTSYPVELPLHELISRRARATPDAIAVVSGDEHLSYAALADASDAVAAALHARDLAPEALVGLAVSRQPALIVGMLGILKAGGAYLPLDPEYPHERLQSMIEDSEVSLVLTEHALTARLPRTGATLLCIEDCPRGVRAAQPSVHPDNLAYCIYTSGSTGRPKGALLTHRNVVRLLESSAETYAFTSQDVWTLFHSSAFDISVWEVFGALCYGGRLVIVPQATCRAPDEFWQLLLRQEVTVLNQTPSAFAPLSHVVEQDVAANVHLRFIVFAGEGLGAAAPRRWVSRFGVTPTKQVNMYGITETTVHVTQHVLTDTSLGDEQVQIGSALPDLSCRLLDAALEPAPIGAVAEIFVGGPGLARGYLRRPALTAERFIPAEGGQRLYRSGDLARYRSDGAFEHLGRIDAQVKIRGHRIELGEIEARLRELSGVKEAAVLAPVNAHAERNLVGYLVLDAQTAHGDAFLVEARAELARRVPAYMLPARLLVVAGLPLTTNGKLDQRALAALTGAEAPRVHAHVSPETETERALARIWQEVLEIERVGATDDFFDLGGHSLLATRVASRIASVFGARLPLAALFEQRSLRELASRIDAAERGKSTPGPRQAFQALSRIGPMPLSAAQRRLWFLWRLDPQSSAFNMPCGVRLRGELDRSILQRALDTLLERHESLRTRFVEDARGEPRQLVEVPQAVEISFVDLSELPEPEREAAAQQQLDQESRQPFDLARGPVVRARLLRLAACEHVLLVMLHHIVTDGWSMAIVVREFSALYAAYHKRQQPRLPALRFQYADYAAWQSAWLDAGERTRQLEYWRTRLSAAYPLLELPADGEHREQVRAPGADYTFELSAELTAQLRAAAQRHGVTLFTTLLGAFAIVASERSGQRSFRLGTDTANRNQIETESIVGFFVNQLVLDIDVDTDAALSAWLTALHARIVSAIDHQDLPFDELVAALRPARNAGRSPFFNVKLIFREQQTGSVQLPGLEMSAVSVVRGGAELALVVDLAVVEARVQVKLQYATALFDAATMVSLGEELSAVARDLAAESTSSLAPLAATARDVRSRRAQVARQDALTRAQAMQHALPIKRRSARKTDPSGKTQTGTE